MADIEKVMSVEDADIEKFMGVARADIEKIMGVEMPSLGAAWLGVRGVIGGGWTGSAVTDAIDHWTISADDTSSSTRTLTVDRQTRSGASNKTVGLWMGGYDSDGYSNVIDKISSISSMGVCASFGTLSEHVNGTQVATNGTIAIRMGGRTSGSGAAGIDTCDKVTIGDSSSVTAGDHGTLNGTNAVYRTGASISGSSRAIVAGGRNASGVSNVIQYKVFASDATSVDLGDLEEAMYVGVGAEDTTRGLIMGGNDDSADLDTIQYLAVDGDGTIVDDAMALSAGDGYGAGVSDGTSAAFAAGSADTDGVRRITIQSLSGTASTTHALTTTDRYAAGGFSGNS